MLQTRLMIRLLGQTSFEIGGEVVTQFRWNRIPALFGYLLVHPGPNSRESIAEALWPDRPADSARHNLRQTLVYCGELLDGQLMEILSVERNSIAINREAAQADIAPFLAAVPRGEDLERARQRHETRLKLYGGPFLANLGDDWINDVRAQVDRAYFESLLFLSQQSLTSDPSRALDLAELAVRQEMFEDAPRAAKIRALIELGREAAAQTEYANFEKLLKEQLLLKPGKSVLQALEESRPVAPLVTLRPDLSDAAAPTIAETLSFLKEQGMMREATELVLALVPFWIRKGNPSQGQELLLSTYAAAERRPGNIENLSLARLAYAQGDNSRAKKVIRDVLAKAPSEDIRAECELIYARIDLTEVKPGVAKQRVISALRSFRRRKDRTAELEGWLVLAMALFANDEFEKVDRRAQRAIHLAEELGDVLSKSHVGIYQAFAWHRRGFSARAFSIADQISRQLSPATTPVASQILCSASRLMEDLGYLEEARQGYMSCIEDCRRLSNVYTLGMVLTYLGDLECESQNFRDSMKIHLEGLKVRRDMDNNLGIATSLRGVGKALLGLGKSDEAKVVLLESAQRYRDDGAVSGHASSQLYLSEAEANSGDLNLAIRLAENSLDILRRLGPTGRLTIGPSGQQILEKGERLLKSMVDRSESGNTALPLTSTVL